MTPDQTAIFVQAFHRPATAMGWNQGTKQITTFANRAGCPIDIIKRYGQIDEAALKFACDRFYKPGQPDS